MLLTLKPPTQSPGFQSPHVYPSPRIDTKTYSPSESKVGPLIHHPAEASERSMTTQHRGLPPPIRMALPNPMSDRGPPQPPSQHPTSMSQNQPMGQLPAPPSSQWPGSGDAMRDWLAAKAEEDKRKQEEERTRQESLRLEQRRIEQSMLRESLQGGIPPHLVPIVFAGMGAGSLASAGVEWAQQHISQMTAQSISTPQQQQQQQQQHQQQLQHQHQHQHQQQQQIPPPQSHQASPDVRRERSFTGPQPNPYATHQPPQSRSYAFDGSKPVQGQIQSGHTSGPRASASSLSRLNTGEMSINQPPLPGSSLPIQSSHSHSQPEPTAQSTPTSNSIYFHHWVPPSNSKEAGSPSDFTNSPKKRKTNALGKTPETSPSFSHPTSATRRNRAMSIQKCEASSDSFRGQAIGIDSRPGSQHRKHSISSITESGLRHGSVQPPETSRNISPPPSGNGGEKGRKRFSSGTPKRDTSLS